MGNQEELTLTICTLCLELYFKVVLLMKVCVQVIWENVATKVKLLCVMCKLSCKVCSQESCSLVFACKARHTEYPHKHRSAQRYAPCLMSADCNLAKQHHVICFHSSNFR